MSREITVRVRCDDCRADVEATAAKLATVLEIVLDAGWLLGLQDVCPGCRGLTPRPGGEAT